MTENKLTNIPYNFLAAIILIAVGIIIYANSTKAPFYVDDLLYTADNTHFHMEKLTFKSIYESGFKSINSNRPISTITLGLNKYFNHKKTQGYHLVNITIHILTALILFFLTKNTLALPDSLYADKSLPIAFFASLLWLTNPVQTASVTYIVQRMTSMATLFYLLSIYLYLKGRLTDIRLKKFFWLAGCIFSGIIAVGCKEIAITLPLILFLYEWYFLQDLKISWLKNKLIYIFLLLGVGLYEGISKKSVIFSLYEHTVFTMSERIITEFRVLIYYISLLFFPHPSRLHFYYDFSVSKSLLNPPTTLISLLLILSLMSAAFIFRKKQKLFSFAILWYFINLFLESSFIGLALVFEHRLYLPSAFFFVPLTAILFCKETFYKPAILILISISLIFSIWTFQRNAVWADNIAFWQNDVDWAPDHPEAHNNLGFELHQQGRYIEAIGHLNEAIRLNPDYTEARFNLANSLNVLKHFHEAEEHYKILLKDPHPRAADIHNNLGISLLWQRKIEEALFHYEEALQLNPSHHLALKNKNELLRRYGKKLNKKKLKNQKP